MVGDVPIVSVIIPCYNMGEFISEAIASVQAQTFTGYEIIVVDDGSDQSSTIVLLNELAASADITLLRTVNRGVAAARNSAIRAARGRYVLPLDADDLIAPDFLEKAIALLESLSDSGIVCCDAQLFGDASGVLSLPEFSVQRLLSENLLFATSLFCKSDWQAVGGYCEAMRYGWEDWEFWIAMTSRQQIPVQRIPEALFSYRIRKRSRDRSMSSVRKVAMLLLIMARHWRCYLHSPGSVLMLLSNAKSFAKRCRYDI